MKKIFIVCVCLVQPVAVLWHSPPEALAASRSQK